MTPLQIAKAECSNYNGDGTCLGLDFDNYGRHCRFKEPGHTCVLSTPGVRCSFFETAVMPMDRSALSPSRRQEWEDALKDYRKAANVGSTKARVCPICNERELEKGHRLCYVCKAQKRQETKRRSRLG